MKAVFLDRDGVINEYPGDFKYVTSPEQFRFLPEIESALKKLIDSIERHALVHVYRNAEVRTISFAMV